MFETVLKITIIIEYCQKITEYYRRSQENFANGKCSMENYIGIENIGNLQKMEVMKSYKNMSIIA